MTTLDFKTTISISATPSEVWQAIVDPAKVAQYHLAPLTVIELSKGGKISYGTDGVEMIAGEILEAIPDKQLIHTFRFAPTQEGTKNDPETEVSYLIEPGEQDTELTLLHTGFTKENQTYVNISGGWPFILDALKNFLEKK
jgi:uncharacterized protein YndB with AHSA1/START domain